MLALAAFLLGMLLLWVGMITESEVITILSYIHLAASLVLLWMYLLGFIHLVH